MNYQIGNSDHHIIVDTRLPRAISSILIGAFLAVSGALIQSITRNAFGDPYLLGVSHGSSFALILILAFFPTATGFQTLMGGLLGAGVTLALVFILVTFSKGRNHPIKLALAGISLGMFLSSLSTILALYFNLSKTMSFWFAGSLTNVNWETVILLVLAGIPALFIIVGIRQDLTVLNIGEEGAQSLGVSIRKVRIFGVIAVLLLTGSSVVVSGVIGFVGLVIPHMIRMLVGSDSKRHLPLTALYGGILLLVSDLLSKMINPPYETPVGVMTALIGVPFFLYLVRKNRGGSLE